MQSISWSVGPARVICESRIPSLVNAAWKVTPISHGADALLRPPRRNLHHPSRCTPCRRPKDDERPERVVGSSTRSLSTGCRREATSSALLERTTSHTQELVSKDDNSVQYSAAVMKLWAEEVNNLAAKYDSELEPVEESHTEQKISLFEEEDDPLAGHHTNTTIWKEFWSMSDLRARAKQFPDLLLLYLREESTATLELLLVTLTDPLPNKVMVADVLDLIVYYVARQAKLSPLERRARVVKLFQMIGLVLRKYRPGFPLTGRSIELLQSNLPQLERIRFYLQLQKRGVVMDTSVVRLGHLLNLAHKLSTKFKTVQTALKLLRLALADSAAAKEHQIQVSQSFGNILAVVGSRNASEMRSILKTMVEFGVPIRAYHYNVLIEKYSASGQFDAAWRVWGDMKISKVEPQATTYTVMSKLCRRTADHKAFRKLYKDLRMQILAEPEFKLDEIAIAELLTAFHGFYGEYRPGTYASCLRFYLRFAEVQPLVNMGMLSFDRPPLSRIAQGQRLLVKSQPSTMLLTKIIGIWAQAPETSYKQLVTAYERFLKLVADEDSLFAAAAKEVHIWHVFLHAFSKRPETMVLWSEIAAAMFDPKTASASWTGIPKALQPLIGVGPGTETDLEPEVKALLDKRSGKPKYSSRKSPLVNLDIRSWTMVLDGFARHKMPEAAQQVMDWLQSGRPAPRPHQVTWNALIKAYTQAGERDRAVQTMEKAQMEGWSWDRHTIRAIRGAHAEEQERRGLGSRVRGGGVKTSMRRKADGSFSNAFLDVDDEEVRRRLYDSS